MGLRVASVSYSRLAPEDTESSRAPTGGKKGMREPEDKKKLEWGFKKTPKSRVGEDQLYSHIDEGWHNNKMPLPHATISEKRSV